MKLLGITILARFCLVQLTLLAATPTGGTASTPEWLNTSLPSLKELARSRGKHFGTNFPYLISDQRNEHKVRADWQQQYSEELATIERHFTLAGAGYQMYPGYSWLGPEKYSIEGSLAFTEWARAHDVEVTLHGLGYIQRGWPANAKLWEGEEVKGLRFEGETLEQRHAWFRGVYARYLDTYLKTFSGRLHSYDVLNEHVRYGKYTGRPMLFNDFPYLKAWGSDKKQTVPGIEFYLETFRRARELDPTAKLCYLDYSNEIICDKANTQYVAARELLKHGCPIDAIGFQLHQGLGLNRVVDKDPANVGGSIAAGTVFHNIDSDARFFDSFRENVARIADLGLDVWTMETDIEASEKLDVAERRARQAFLYRKFVEMCLEFPNFTVFKLWATKDNKNASKFAKTDAYLFDSEFRPKPAFYAVADTFATYRPEVRWENTFDGATADWTLESGARLSAPARTGAAALALSTPGARATRTIDLDGSYAAHLSYRWQWSAKPSSGLRVLVEVVGADGRCIGLKQHDATEADLRKFEDGWRAGYCTLEGFDGMKNLRLRFSLEGPDTTSAPTFSIDDLRLIADHAGR